MTMRRQPGFTLSRRDILLAGAAAAGGWAVPRALTAVSASRPTRPIFGWTTCLTYEAGPKPLGQEHFLPLIEEMKRHGMSRVIVMPSSEGYFDPLHHGLAWPTSHPKLKTMIDPAALNASVKTEFFSRFIEAAHAHALEVFIELKYLGLAGVEEAYPGIEFVCGPDGQRIAHAPEGSAIEVRRRIDTLHICCDSAPARQFMQDKIEDVLSRYPKLDGIVLEHPSYGANTCYCPATRQQVMKDLGKPIEQLALKEFNRWKGERIRDTLIEIRKFARSIVPDLKLGFYTGFSPPDGNIAAFQESRGHDINTLRHIGWDFLMPYGEGRHKERETAELERVIEYLAPMPIYLHTVVRRESPHNYPLPVKDPAYVHNIIKWGKQMANREPRFTGMSFFNEVKIPPDNRRAVYDALADD